MLSLNLPTLGFFLRNGKDHMKNLVFFWKKLPKFGYDLFLGVPSFLVTSKIVSYPRYHVLVCLYVQFLSDLLTHLD